MDNLDLKALYPVLDNIKVFHTGEDEKYTLCVLTSNPNRIHCIFTFDDYTDSQYACIALRTAITDLITTLEVSIDEISRNKRS